MGHYHRIVNLTQHARIVPMDVGSLDKLLEFGQDPGSAMAALWLLLGREAWCGDRIAILGYEGRPEDLAREVLVETGLDGTAYYDRSLADAGDQARAVLVERGICTFTVDTHDGVEHWRRAEPAEVEPAGADVVAANLDRGEILDPLQFGQSRDLHLAAAHGGMGGVTTALAAVLAASNRGGSRGSGDLRSTDPVVGSWAGDHLGVVPLTLTKHFEDISGHVRDVLEAAGEARYARVGGHVHLLEPPFMKRALRLSPRG